MAPAGAWGWNSWGVSGVWKVAWGRTCFGVRGGVPDRWASISDPVSSWGCEKGAGSGVVSNRTALTTFRLPRLMIVFPFHLEGESLGFASDMHHK